MLDDRYVSKVLVCKVAFFGLVLCGVVKVWSVEV